MRGGEVCVCVCLLCVGATSVLSCCLCVCLRVWGFLSPTPSVAFCLFIFLTFQRHHNEGNMHHTRLGLRRGLTFARHAQKSRCPKIRRWK